MTDVDSWKTTRRLIGLTVAILVCARVAGAQPAPNFSGTWDPVKADPPGLGGATQTVIHTDTTLTLGHASAGGGHRFVYKLDGSPNHSTLMNVKSVATASVDRGKLTIARVDHYPDGRIRENRQVWSLDSAGNLVIEGTDGLRGETPTTRKTTYKKRVPEI